tara:strand:- start:479 stop:592 length:114 start_codon:yes stop_codon:yes gene_type:complete
MGVEAGFGLLALGMIVSVVVLYVLIKVREYDDENKQD